MNYKNNIYGYPYKEDRFLVPFLLGGLGGAALTGLTRPHPVYVNPPIYQTPYPMPMMQGYGYSNYNYYY